MSKKNNYGYLAQYINDQHIDNNCFYPLSLKEIEIEENRLGFKFPYQLREFYLEIGYGFFIHTHGKKEIQTAHANRLMDPTSVADIFLLGYESGQILPSVKFKAGDLPFFEVGDGANFLFLRPHDANTNTVYGSLGEIIEPEFEKFIWRLYYENPTYYMEKWAIKKV